MFGCRDLSLFKLLRYVWVLRQAHVACVVSSSSLPCRSRTIWHLQYISGSPVTADRNLEGQGAAPHFPVFCCKTNWYRVALAISAKMGRANRSFCGKQLFLWGFGNGGGWDHPSYKMWLLQHQLAACVGVSWCCSQRWLLLLYLFAQQKRGLLYVGCGRKLGSNVLWQSSIRTLLWCNKGVRSDGYVGSRGCLAGLWPGPCFVVCLAALHFGHRFLWAGRFAALLQPSKCCPSGVSSVWWPIIWDPCFTACVAALHFGYGCLWAGHFATLLQPCPLHPSGLSSVQLRRRLWLEGTSSRCCACHTGTRKTCAEPSKAEPRAPESFISRALFWGAVRQGNNARVLSAMCRPWLRSNPNEASALLFPKRGGVLVPLNLEAPQTGIHYRRELG